MLPDILTIDQVAEYLQLSPDEVRQELEQKHLPGRLIAGKWRVQRQALDKLLEISPDTEQSASLADNPAVIPTLDHKNESALAQPDPSESPESTHTGQASHLSDGELAPTLNEGMEQSTKAQPQSLSEDSQLANQSALLLKNLESTLPPSQEHQTDSVPTKLSKPTNPYVQQPQRFSGEVFAYNAKQRFGHARLADKNVIWLEAAHLLDKNYNPQLGDEITFEIEHTRKGKQARNICLAKDEKSYVIKTEMSVANNRPTSKTNVHDQEKNGVSIQAPKASLSLGTAKHRPPRSGTPKAQQLYRKAAIARTEGRTHEARRLFRRAIEAGAGIDMYAAFVKMLNETGDKQEAQQVIQQAINTFPDHANFYNISGHMERRSRSYTQAEENFRRGLEIEPSHRNLQLGLAQVLVQKGTQENLKEAGRIYQKLDRQRRLDKRDGYYQRYKAFQRSPRAYTAFTFFQECQMKPGITGTRNLPRGVTDLVIDIQIQEFSESFGLSDAILVRCFANRPRQADLVELCEYLRGFGPQDILGVQDSRRFIINKSLVFIAVSNSDEIRDQVMNILSENGEAIVPLDDGQLANLDVPLQVLRDVLGQYLGSRDLYGGNLPVSGRRFFGREKLLRELADRIQQGQFLGIYGLRKMGKTSLLYQLRDQSLHTEAVAYVDLQNSAVLSEKNCHPLYWELERDLYQRLQKPYPTLANLLRLGKIARFSDLPEQGKRARLLFDEDIRALLDEILEKQSLAIKQLIIVLDELEWILPIGHQKPIDGYLEFFGLLRGLTQTERYRGLISSIVVAANASISEQGYWEERENPVFAFYASIFLPPLTFDECNEMIRSLGKNMSVYWDETALEKIFAETGGHPFLTRLFCSHMVNEYHHRPLNLRQDMVDKQLLPFLRGQGDKFGQITELLHRNFPEEEKFLEQIALDETPSNLSDEALHHLIGYQLIRQDGDQYQITLNLLRRWLRQRAGVRD